MKLRKINKFILILGSLFLILLGIRLSLPYVAKKSINYALSNKLEKYTGFITDFDLSLWRGAYQVQGLVIQKKTNKKPHFVDIKEIDLSIVWSALWRKELTMDITIDEFVLNILDSQDKKEKQSGADEKNWSDAIKFIIPLHIENLKIRNSKLTFTNRSLKNAIPVVLDNIYIQVDNLRTSDTDYSDSTIAIKTRVQEHAQLNLNGFINLLEAPLVGDFDVKIEKFDLSTVNENLRYYVPLDVSKGILSLYGEVALKAESVDGYAKIFLKDADIIADDQDYKSIKHFFYELGAAVGNWFLKNDKTKNVAGYLPFKGTRENIDFNFDKFLDTLLENEGNALTRKIDHSINLKSEDKKSEKLSE